MPEDCDQTACHAPEAEVTHEAHLPCEEQDVRAVEGDVGCPGSLIAPRHGGNQRGCCRPEHHNCGSGIQVGAREQLACISTGFRRIAQDSALVAIEPRCCTADMCCCIKSLGKHTALGSIVSAFRVSQYRHRCNNHLDVLQLFPNALHA